MRTIKEQVKEISIPTGTSAGTPDFSVEFDSAYEKCDGIALAQISDGGVSHYKVQISDETQTYVDMIHKTLLESNESVAPDLKYRTVDIPNAKQKLQIKVMVPGTLTKDLKFDLVFRLKRKPAKE